MTVGELLERLQDLDPEMEVRLMTQMNWPFENSIVGICTRSEMHAEQDGDEDAEPDSDAEEILYIVEGQQICYGDSAAWDAAW